LALATRIEQKSGRAYALLNLAAISLREEPATSRAFANEALHLGRATGEKAVVAQALTALAEAAAASGDASEAEALVRESLAAYVELSDRLATVRSLEMLAVLAFRDGRADRGLLLGSAASSLRRLHGLRLGAWGDGELEAAIATQPDDAEAWTRGSSLTLGDAVAEALEPSETVVVRS